MFLIHRQSYILAMHSWSPGETTVDAAEDQPETIAGIERLPDSDDTERTWKRSDRPHDDQPYSLTNMNKIQEGPK
jgi:hypothetical protein